MATIIGGYDTGLLDTSLYLLNRNDKTQAGATGHGEEIFANVSNGNLILRHQDAWLPSEGEDYLLTRTYNSRGSWNNNVGKGWTLTSFLELSQITSNKITLINPDSSQFTFLYDAAAEAAFTQALNLDPDLADAHAGQAIAYLGLTQTARAEAALAQAKRLDPSNLTVMLVEAGMAGQQGNAAAARRIMDELMQAGSFSQAGWSNRELVERGQQSATGKRVSAKWTRYLRQQQRRKRVVGQGPSRLH